MPNIPLIARHSGSSACGVTPQDAHRAAYHTRTPERAPDRGGKRGVPWLHTLCGVRYSMPHRVSTPPEQRSPRYGGDRIASIRIGRTVTQKRKASQSMLLPADCARPWKAAKKDQRAHAPAGPILMLFATEPFYPDTHPARQCCKKRRALGGTEVKRTGKQEDDPPTDGCTFP